MNSLFVARIVFNSEFYYEALNQSVREVGVRKVKLIPPDENGHMSPLHFV